MSVAWTSEVRSKQQQISAVVTTTKLLEEAGM
jgi:hypothetical protein